MPAILYSSKWFLFLWVLFGFGLSAVLEWASRGITIKIPNRIFEYVILLFTLLLVIWNGALTLLISASATGASEMSPEVLLLWFHVFLILSYILFGFIVGVMIFTFIRGNRNKRNEQRIEQLNLIAYRLWQEDGCPIGHDREHWAKAEAIWNKLHNKKLIR
jgi:hypothetical protein